MNGGLFQKNLSLMLAFISYLITLPQQFVSDYVEFQLLNTSCLNVEKSGIAIDSITAVKISSHV